MPDYLTNQTIADLADAGANEWAQRVALPIAEGVVLLIMGQDHPEHDDAVQIVTLQLLKVRSRIKLDRNPFGYLTQIGARECLHVIRKSRGHERLRSRYAQHLAHERDMRGRRVETTR